MDIENIKSIYNLPLLELISRANAVLRKFHGNTIVQCCQVYNIKEGGCSEDCSYCAQSSRYTTHVTPKAMLNVKEVLEQALDSKKAGVTRICLSAAWREARQSGAFDRVLAMVEGIKSLGLEVCCTLGMLEQEHIEKLKTAGAYAINHNIDTSEEYYPKVVTTRNFQDRLETIAKVGASGISVCCGGIIGMGESVEDRLSMLQTLTSMDPLPESVPINMLVPISGTPFEHKAKVTSWEFVRMIATTRIVMPKAMVRLSGGRGGLTISQQALCFLAGANSIHVGPRLLTTPNPEHNVDQEMFKILGLTPQEAYAKQPFSTPSEHVETYMKKALAKRADEGILRGLKNCNDLNDLIDLTSNDYLGFARSKDLFESITEKFYDLVQEGQIRPHVGTTGSRLLTGNSLYAESLEQNIAKYHSAEAGLLFNSGYVANTGLLSAVITKEDTIIVDTQVHASTWEGAKLSGARQLLFRHNDVEHLDTQLKKCSGRIYVCVEALYSMSGDIAPLEQIYQICDRYGANLIVDEAHSTGILGERGRGLVSALGLEQKVFARIHTFGKALGIHGAIVLGSQTLKEYLVNFSRPFMYTTAFPLHTLLSIECAYDKLKKASKEYRQLQTVISTFKEQIEAYSLPISVNSTPIQTIKVAGSTRAKQLSHYLAKKGLDVRAILSPTVRKGEESLRVCLHAFNTKKDVEKLAIALAEEPHLLLSQKII